MRVKLAAKMLVIAWTLMKKKEPFDPAYLKIKFGERARLWALGPFKDLGRDPVWIFQTNQAIQEYSIASNVYWPAPARRLFGGTELCNLDKACLRAFTHRQG
ncbi:MAG: hypothetical protein JRI72_14835 [Deltaproteobacteria bacterium]|nr:hypothetical protein [Deltaproteobacteria bacterium]